MVTDADFHNNFVNADPYSFPAPTFIDAVSALNAGGIKTIGILSAAPPVGLANLEAFAEATGAVLPVSAIEFASTGQCSTGISGGPRAPTTGGMCPLVFLISDTGVGLTDAVVRGVLGAAGL